MKDRRSRRRVARSMYCRAVTLNKKLQLKLLDIHTRDESVTFS